MLLTLPWVGFLSLALVQYTLAVPQPDRRTIANATSTSLAPSPSATNVSYNETVALASVLAELVAGTATGDPTCSDCESILLILKEAATLGDDVFIKLFQEVCIDTGSASTAECTGLVALEGSSMAYSLRNMVIPSRTAKIFCNTVMGICPLPAVEPYVVSFPKPKPTASAAPVSSSGSTPLQIVHISDIHVDHSYVAGSNYNCANSICCHVLTPSDAPNVTQYHAGPFGNTNCDSPVDLEESLYAAIQELIPDAAFTLFTGDLVEGAVWLTTKQEVINDMNDVKSKMSGLDLVYSAVGNHDSGVVNLFPQSGLPANITSSSQYIYDTLSSDWESWIGTEAAAQVTNNFGSYSVVHPNSNLRIISVNTQFWTKENFWLYTPTMSRDPSGQLAWLVSELQSAEDAGQRAYIIGHMPMGRTDALWDYSDYFDQVIQRYSATIASQFFGHTHHDQWEVAYTDYLNQTASSATAISYITSALTPTSGNPTFRVYSVDPDTYEVLDYTVYFANYTLPGYQSKPTWAKYYSVKETYGALLDPPYTDPSAPLTPEFWHNVTQMFIEDDTQFNNYYARRTRGLNVTSCTGSCKAQEICQLRSPQSQYNCVNGAVNAANATTLYKRDGDDQARLNAVDDCHHSFIGIKVGQGIAADLSAFAKKVAVVLGESFTSRKIRRDI
ncbi:hypothetical protein BP5796_04990 [Coleophoma crateriformis]|uniref:Uncharacterized protein n=1 Tax=Coleophoma crateriformis TaxID=565419 RepID=A0A3D8SAU2_9HELO|nr:hypothetical protein BP5796_04990 [Coleophoma crateriformis]